MGRGMHWQENHPYIDTWEGMVRHMEEEHNEAGFMHRMMSYDTPIVESHKKTFDFGQISKNDGITNTTFEIENHGRETLILSDISTSCGCTSATFDKTEIGFNETAQLTVYFDPNFHDEPQGELTRSVFVKTNDPTTPELQFDIYVEILD